MAIHLKCQLPLHRETGSGPVANLLCATMWTHGCSRRATEDKGEDAGMFHWSNMSMKAACELHEELPKAFFGVGKQILPEEMQAALHRFSRMHNSRLVFFLSDGVRGVRQQAQRIANLMSYVNTKRRHVADGSRTKPFMNRLGEASAGSEG